MKKYLAAAVVGAAAGIGIYKATERKRKKAEKAGEHAPYGPYEAYFKLLFDTVRAVLKRGGINSEAPATMEKSGG